MASEETDITNRIMLAISPLGARVFKNVRGLFLTLDGKRKVRAGLQFDGASDLIGFTSVTVTPEMVGRKIAVFTALEVKTQKGRASGAQEKFINLARYHGAIASVVRSDAESASVIREFLKAH